MRRGRFIHHIVALLPLLGFPGPAAAQIAGGDASKSPSSASDWGGSAALVLVVFVLIFAIGGAVKLYDLKRKREDEALSLQSRLSDILLRDFGTLPVTPVARGSGWRRSPVVIAIEGSVPTLELRETVMRLVHQELARHHPDAQAEDRLVVDPLVREERAV